MAGADLTTPIRPLAPTDPTPAGLEAMARLDVALMEDSKPARLLAMLKRADAWLDVPQGAAPADAHAADPILAGQALALLSARAMARLGLAAGPDWPARAAAFDARAHTPAEQAEVDRFARAGALKAALGLDQPAPPPAEDELALRAQMDQLYGRQLELQAHTTPGDVQAQALDGLDALLADYRALRSAARADNPALPHLCFLAASAAFALGRGRGLSGQLRLASAAYGQAAELYAAADDLDQAAAAHEEAERTGFATSADVDGASLADLARLADGIADPVDRARTLMRLSDRAAEANDAFSALTHAQAALAALAQAGFLEPASGQVEAMAATWVTSACGRATGGGVVRLLASVGTTLQRTWALRWRADPQVHTAAAQADFDALSALMQRFVADSAAVQDRVRAGLAAYGFVTAPAAAVPPSRTAGATELMKRIGDAETIAQADARVVEAKTLGMPSLIAQACLAQAILRLDAGDVTGSLAASAKGEAALLPGAAQADTLIGLPSFDILVELRRQRLGGLSQSKDTQGAFDCAWATVRTIEAARYRISDPFPQAAFLSQRTAFYEMAAFTAFKLDRWDDLLTAMDLFKARSAIRNRLAPPADADATALALRLQQATHALAAAAPEQRAALAASRQAVWDLLTVSRLSRTDAANLPALSVAAIQAVLAPEAAVVSWSFVAPGILIVLAIDAHGLHAERVIMTDDQQALLAQYIAAMEASQVHNRALGRTVSALATVLLPPATLAFIASAKRLIFSPHRKLNLLPLHAARLGDAYLIEQASVRYVPNLASLLTPWRGGGEGVAVIGLNQSDMAGYPALSDAEAEADAAAAAWTAHGQPAARLIGPAATVAGVEAFDLASRRCLHIATHGSSIFLGDARADPFASHLVLKDGFLDALSISQLALRAEVVVMGACYSGQRALDMPGLEELPGDDMFGLQSAFFQAGVRSVVGSLWPLDDASAARMLPALHQGLAAGVPADLALQAAVRSELSNWAVSDIYGWAALFLSTLGREPPSDGSHGHA